MLKSRIITASILLLFLLLFMFVLPSVWWQGLVVVTVMQATLEWTKLARLSSRISYIYSALSLLIMVALLWFYPEKPFDTLAIPHLFIYAVSAVLWLIIVPAWMIAGWRIQHPLLMCLTGWAIIIPTGLAMLDLYSISPLLLLFLLCLVWVADIGAYFSGRRFGKHKLAPRISPGKTWEGVIGALLGVTLYVVLVWFLSPLHEQHLPVLLLAAGWWVGLAVIGDLFESAIKRQAGVKDSGALLPGHGGLLDRIDALTSTLPLAALVILLQQMS